MYCIFRQFLYTSAKILFCPFLKILSQILPLVCISGKERNEKNNFANTPFIIRTK